MSQARAIIALRRKASSTWEAIRNIRALRRAPPDQDPPKPSVPATSGRVLAGALRRRRGSGLGLLVPAGAGGAWAWPAASRSRRSRAVAAAALAAVRGSYLVRRRLTGRSCRAGAAKDDPAAPDQIPCAGGRRDQRTNVSRPSAGNLNPASGRPIRAIRQIYADTPDFRRRTLTRGVRCRVSRRCPRYARRDGFPRTLLARVSPVEHHGPSTRSPAPPSAYPDIYGQIDAKNRYLLCRLESAIVVKSN